MTPSNVDTLGALFRRSVRLHPLATQAEAEAILGHAADRRSASDALFNGLVVRENTGIRKGFLDEAARHHFLAARVRGHPPELADAISNLSAYLPGVIQADGSRVPSGPITNGHHRQPHVPAYLKRLDDRDAWTDALLVARASAMLNRFSFSVARTTAIADAADRMKARGYRFTVAEGRIEITSEDMVRIVRAIEDYLACLGSFNALQNLFTLALKDHVWDFEQILFGQRHAPGRGERLPSVPIGLLFNLAMKQNFAAGDPAAAGWAWIEAVTLSRDFVAMLDLETYTQFDHLGIDARNLEEKLRRITHSDHCFSLRQWDFSFTPDFLESFFGNGFDTNLKQECGWDVSDVLSLCKIVEPYLDKMPRLVAKESFYSRGLGSTTLQAIFRDFCHEDGQANADYRSPFDADGFDSIFKPFIMVHTPKGYSLLLPPKSLIGPAIYEAVFAAVKKPLSSKQVSDLRGAGTEGLTKRIFAKHGFRPSLAGAEYKLPEGYGECDFVFEDDSNILLVECKAKPLTRRAMTGGVADAMLDFAGGLVASQAQSLRHERLLRTRGDIEFIDRRRLTFNNRHITRLSVSLTDQGTLQDRWMLYAAYEALLTAEVTSAPDYAKKKQVKDFNEKLNLLRNETRLLVDAGHELHAHRLNAGSACVAQLEIMLRGTQSLADVREMVAKRASFNTGNPLLEHHHLERIRRHAHEQAVS